MAEYRRTGRAFYTDPETGVITGDVHEDGAPKFRPETKRRAGGGFYEDRDERGQTRRYRAPIKWGEDGKARAVYAPGDEEELGDFVTLGSSEDPELSKAAKAEYGRRLGEVRKAARRPTWAEVDAASLELETAKAELGEIPARRKAVEAKVEEAAKAGLVEFGASVGDKISGKGRSWKAKTPEAQALLDEMAALTARENELMSATADDFKGPKGDLVKAKLAAIARSNVARDLLRGAAVEDMEQAREAWLERNGGDPKADPVLKALREAAEKQGFRRQPKAGHRQTGPKPAYEGELAAGPKSWDEVPQEELDAGPKGGARGLAPDNTPAAEQDDDEGERDELDRVLEHHGLEVPTFSAGQEVAGRKLSEAEAERLNARVPSLVRQVFKGEALQDLDRYQGERAAGLWANGLNYAVRRALGQKDE